MLKSIGLLLRSSSINSEKSFNSGSGGSNELLIGGRMVVVLDSYWSVVAAALRCEYLPLKKMLQN